MGVWPWRWTMRLSTWLAAALLLVLATGFAYEQIGRARDREMLPPRVGRAIDIGGGRRINLYCSGSGGPAVVLETGATRPVTLGCWCSRRSLRSRGPAGTTAQGKVGAIRHPGRARAQGSPAICTKSCALAVYRPPMYLWAGPWVAILSAYLQPGTLRRSPASCWLIRPIRIRMNPEHEIFIQSNAPGRTGISLRCMAGNGSIRISAVGGLFQAATLAAAIEHRAAEGLQHFAQPAPSLRDGCGRCVCGNKRWGHRASSRQRQSRGRQCRSRGRQSRRPSLDRADGGKILHSA